MPHPSLTEPLLTIEPFVGHRIWRVIPVDEEPVLASATNGDPWMTAEQKAECHAGVLLVPKHRRPVPAVHADSEIPALDCTCGIYAATTWRSPPHRRVWAAGPVRLWGRVIEGTSGYRAEYGRVGGDLEVMLGMGRGRARCTNPSCRALADRVWAGSTSYLARCGAHGRSATMGIEEFMAEVDRSFRRRYDVGAAIVPR